MLPEVVAPKIAVLAIEYILLRFFVKYQIWEQVAALPDKHRLVLFLYYYQGYATDEIAQILGENSSTVRSRLVQARRKLKLRLETEGYGTT
nr:sigma factor-like helix-turn-helix DNA-binding protein [Pseudoflavonifractor sp. 60]